MTNKSFETSIITPEGRAFYLALREPVQNRFSGKMQYKVCLALPKENAKGIKRVQTAIRNAGELGIAEGRWTKDDLVKSLVPHPLMDGDPQVEQEKLGPEFAGTWYMNIYSDNQREVVKQTDMGLVYLDPDNDEFDREIYSGMICRVAVNFYLPKDKAIKRICAGLNSVMKTGDAQRMDGIQSAAQAFAKYGKVYEAPTTPSEGTSTQAADVDTAELF